VEGDAVDWCDALSHEALVVLDGAQHLTGVIHHTHQLLRRPAAPTFTTVRLGDDDNVNVSDNSRVI